MISAGDYRPRHQLESNVYSAAASSRAKQAAVKAVALRENASELEQMYITAIAARRLPGGANPDEGYISALRAIVAKYPQEVEARLFLSLHLMRGLNCLRRHLGNFRWSRWRFCGNC